MTRVGEWEVIQACLDEKAAIGRAEATALLGVTRVHASHTLSALYRRGELELVGKARGRGVR